MAERLAAKQQRAVATKTTFIIKPFADRPGVASVYVQTEEMRRSDICGCRQYRRVSCEALSRPMCKACSSSKRLGSR